jgi:hypothetical protein
MAGVVPGRFRCGSLNRSPVSVLSVWKPARYLRHVERPWTQWTFWLSEFPPFKAVLFCEPLTAVGEEHEREN